MTTLDPTLLPALDAVIAALERPASRVRIYANDPAADHDVANFARQVARDRSWREALPEVEEGGERYEDWCEREQGYHGDRR
jgi:hypothetical protein